MMGIAAIAAAIVSFGVTAALGIFLIPYLKRLKFGQTIKDIGPSWHKNKQGTPTMGGIMFIAGILIACIIGFVFSIVSDKEKVDPYGCAKLFAGLAMAVGFGLMGYVDDYIKVVKRRNLGLKAKQKLLIQLFIAIAYLFVLQITGCISTIVDIPFLGQLQFGFFYYPLMVFIIVGTTNAVNLTDGVDGLAASVTFVASLGFMVFAGRLEEGYIGILAAASAAGCLGFLIWNFHPAKVFMGDTGSMFLGGLVVAMAFGIDMPLLLILVGFIYFVEALSVILQVISFKTTGKRIFKMSPIHHHFEMSGWSEVKIVAVFSIITTVMCVIAYFAVTLVG